MTEEQLANAAELMSDAYDRLAVAYDRFVESVLRHTDMMTSSMEFLKLFEEQMDLRLKIFDARLDMKSTILDSLKSLSAVLAEAGASWHENNEKLDLIMKKLDAHLGGEAGLEYDN
jgi:hypothetical protein